MTVDKTRSLLEPEWLAESMRVTFFVSAPLPPQERLLSLLGFIPDQINDRPAQRQRQEIVAFEEGLLGMAESPGRLDILYSADIKAGPLPIFQIGEMQAAFSRCCEMGRIICGKLGPINRMAVGPIGVRQAQSERELTEAMLRYFPTLPADPDTDVELQWSLARRRPATTFDGRLIHFQKWQTITNQILSPFQAGFASPQTGSTAVYLLRAEIDINTQLGDPQATFGAERLEVYQEICNRAQGVLETGPA